MKSAVEVQLNIRTRFPVGDPAVHEMVWAGVGAYSDDGSRVVLDQGPGKPLLVIRWEEVARRDLPPPPGAFSIRLDPPNNKNREPS